MYDGGLNYPLCDYNDFGHQFRMFSGTGGNPHLIIIGRDTKLVFSQYGYMTEEDIRAAIESALADYGDLHQVEDLVSVYMDEDEKMIDLGQKFISLSSETINYALNKKENKSVVDAFISGSDLILSRGDNTGIEEIFITASTATETTSDSFKVMAYPSNAQIVSFELDENYENFIHLSGEGRWSYNKEDYFHRIGSLRSDELAAPEAEGRVVYSAVRIDFISDRLDTAAFAYKISSQYDSDGFDFYLNTEWLELPDNKWSGEIDWTFAEYEVPAGKHSLEWDYFKYEYGYAGIDAAWVDLMRIPGTVTSIEFMPVVSDHDIATNYPNPFNSETVLQFSLRKSSPASVKIFNQSGQAVMAFETGRLNKGYNRLNLRFDDLESGVYFYRIFTSGQSFNGRMLYLK
ncbi:MAG: T9SS type A sorting domain-containing protein [Candidatus Delongbacteria bacterium]